MTADIIMAVATLVFVMPVAWLLLRWVVGILVHRRQVAAQRRRERDREPESYGDAGGVPVIEKRGTVEIIPEPGYPARPAFLTRTKGDQAALRKSHVTRMPR